MHVYQLDKTRIRISRSNILLKKKKKKKTPEEVSSVKCFVMITCSTEPRSVGNVSSSEIKRWGYKVLSATARRQVHEK